MKKKAFKAAFPLTVPVLAGYLFLGIGFGVLLQSKGYSFIWAFFMSITMYTGTMQYAAVDLLANGASLISTAVLTLIINARHLFYGISMVGKYRDMGAARNILAFQMTDETYSITCTIEPPEGINRKWFFLFISMLDHLYWIIGCTLGAILGAVLPFDFKGVDFSMTALFVIVFVEQWQAKKNHLPAITGIVCSLVSLAVFGADGFIVPAMVMTTVIIMVFRKQICRGN
ncbi:MAG: AzlC family ABC transporter permease [Clostridia bacterium]|nr:AzlC family ABC transporter permease [Clostridia bacterium]